MNIVEITERRGALCREILATLPDWFGIPEAVDEYVRVADTLPVFAAYDGDRALGMVSVLRHYDAAGEIHVMGVRPEAHRRGVGRALVERVEQMLIDEGREFLTVKTLSPSAPNEPYDRTRAFYLGLGFRLLEEFPTLWDPRNPAVLMIKPLRTNRG